MARYEVEGAVAGFVTIPDGPPSGGGANPPSYWYANFQGPEQTSGPLNITIPSNGNYIPGYLDLPSSGDRRISVSSDFVVSVENPFTNPIDVWAQIGVSAPSEQEYPCRPYVGVMHSVSRGRIAPGTMAVLHVIRLDVINPALLATPIPWTLVGKPRLAPQVFGPVGTKLCNCAVRMTLT